MDNEIKMLREHMGLTQTELADKLGVSRRTIYRWEMKQHKPLPVFQKLIKELMAEGVK
jgi:DNA-binding XRE family transcriptional regulator